MSFGWIWRVMPTPWPGACEMASLALNCAISLAREANEVFAILDKTLADQLREKGAVFYQWNPPRAKPGLLGEMKCWCDWSPVLRPRLDEMDRFVELLSG